MTPAMTHLLVGEVTGEPWRVLLVTPTEVIGSDDYPTLVEATDMARETLDVFAQPFTVHVVPAHTCPRCAGSIPSANARGQYPGAISRRFAGVEICSDCGTAEAFHDFYGTHAQEMRWWIADD